MDPTPSRGMREIEGRGMREIEGRGMRTHWHDEGVKFRKMYVDLFLKYLRFSCLDLTLIRRRIRRVSECYVYILASKKNGTLYIGLTRDLVQRVWQHKNNLVESFTSKYHVHSLVYYEIHDEVMEAARRERRLKNWKRLWKLNLIEGFNPGWKDLYEEICS